MESPHDGRFAAGALAGGLGEIADGADGDAVVAFEREGHADMNRLLLSLTASVTLRLSAWSEGGVAVSKPISWLGYLFFFFLRVAVETSDVQCWSGRLHLDF